MHPNSKFYEFPKARTLDKKARTGFWRGERVHGEHIKAWQRERSYTPGSGERGKRGKNY